jgi:hypothetical protein
MCKNKTCKNGSEFEYCEKCVVARKKASATQYLKKITKKKLANYSDQDEIKVPELHDSSRKKSKKTNIDETKVEMLHDDSSSDDTEISPLVKTLTEPTVLTAMIVEDESMRLQVVAKFEKNFDDVYNLAVSETSKFNNIYKVQRKPLPKLFGLIEDGSTLDTLVSDHHRKTPYTRLRHVFDTCQRLSVLRKQVPMKRITAQEYLKYEACDNVQHVLSMMDFEKPAMLQLTIGDVMSSEISSKVSKDILAPIEFVPSRVKSIQSELMGMEKELVVFQNDYDGFTKAEIKSAHTVPAQMFFKPSTLESDKNRLSDICLCANCVSKIGCLALMMEEVVSVPLRDEIPVINYESTVLTDNLSFAQPMALKMSGVDNHAVVQAGRATISTADSEDRLLKFKLAIDSAILHGDGVEIDTHLDPLQVPIQTWAKFIPVSKNVRFEISNVTNRLSIMVNNYDDHFKENEVGVVLGFQGSIFDGMPSAYLQEAVKRVTYRREPQRHHKSGIVVEDDGTNLIINSSVASKSMVFEESKEVTTTIVDGNTTTKTKVKILSKMEMKESIVQKWQMHKRDFSDHLGHWNPIHKLYSASKEEKRQYELRRGAPSSAVKSEDNEVRGLQEELERINEERNDVKIANVFADLALYRSQLGAYKKQIQGFVKKSLIGLSSDPNLYADVTTALKVGALSGGKVNGNKLIIPGQNAIEVPRDWKSKTSQMFSDALVGEKNIFHDIDEITIADMESDVLTRVDEQENMQKQVNSKLRELRNRSNAVDKILNGPRIQSIVNAQKIKKMMDNFNKK